MNVTATAVMSVCVVQLIAIKKSGLDAVTILL